MYVSMFSIVAQGDIILTMYGEETAGLSRKKETEGKLVITKQKSTLLIRHSVRSFLQPQAVLLPTKISF